ncbi:major facilitator superfamily domain-containing protein 1 isoform X7 [Passer montanus]|uniref:major facilitator superfamily domain-containing protein 1 isoform X7 n=1 Tax=Passer montanus TaxID=9160 RepID=UPI0019606447|nr:major facilitator superfamily domain-containing protein 1 isoform X7 [Passer montanus]
MAAMAAAPRALPAPCPPPATPAACRTACSSWPSCASWGSVRHGPGGRAWGRGVGPGRSPEACPSPRRQLLLLRQPGRSADAGSAAGSGALFPPPCCAGHEGEHGPVHGTLRLVLVAQRGAVLLRGLPHRQGVRHPVGHCNIQQLCVCWAGGFCSGSTVQHLLADGSGQIHIWDWWGVPGSGPEHLRSELVQGQGAQPGVWTAAQHGQDWEHGEHEYYGLDLLQSSGSPGPRWSQHPRPGSAHRWGHLSLLTELCFNPGLPGQESREAALQRAGENRGSDQADRCEGFLPVLVAHLCHLCLLLRCSVPFHWPWQHRVHHLSPHVPCVWPAGGQSWQEHHLGAVCCAHHAGLTHPAGLHLLEPLDSHVSLIAVVMLYFVNHLTGGDLNWSAKKRAKLQKAAASDSQLITAPVSQPWPTEVC